MSHKNSVIQLGRREFGALAAGMLAVPGSAWARSIAGRTVFYVAVGANLVLYQVDDKGLTLTRQTVTKVPEAIQYIWRHPVKNLIYVAYSNRFSTKRDDDHGVAAYRLDPQTGQLAAFKSPTRLANRPVNMSLDPAGQYMLLAFNNPSELAIYRLAADGSIGELVKQPEPVDAGIYAHQIRVTPSGRLVVLCTRGNDPTATTHEDPGAIKVFQFKNGELRNEHSVGNGNGLGFGPRHVDFHPTRPFMYVSMERNNQLLTYGVRNDGITPRPLFTKDTVDHPELRAPTQYVGPIHVHPNGKYVYLANRSDGTTDFQGKQVYAGGENSVAVFAINQASGEPTLVQSIPTQTFHCRTFSIHPGGRMLVTASVAPLMVRDGAQIRTVPAGLTVFGIGDDGKLAFARKYDVDVGDDQMFWCGMVAL